MKTVLNAIYRYIKSTDKLLIALCATASVFSVVMLMGIANSGYVRVSRVEVQMIASVLGLCAMVVVSLIDYRTMAKLWKFHVPLTYFLVLLTFTPLGIQRDDDRAWLPLPFNLTLQPSELLKLSFIIIFALHLQNARENLNNPKTLLGVLLHGAAPVLLILIQGDAGTALVFVAIFCAMVFAAGLDYRYILAGGGSAVALLPLIWFFVMDDDKRRRFLAVYNYDLDPLGIGLQQRYGRRALGSGQMWGKGIFSGTHQYVPEMYNDFIFTFVGESLGFVGCIGVVLLLASLSLRILYTSSKAQDSLGKYICVGVFAMIGVQTIINLGMCLSLLPVVGVTLPLISAGGTSVVTTYLGIGLALSVHMNNRLNLFSDK